MPPDGGIVALQEQLLNDGNCSNEEQNLIEKNFTEKKLEANLELPKLEVRPSIEINGSDTESQGQFYKKSS